MIQLRDYQESGIIGCREAYRRGRRAPILLGPTGCGKSRMAAAIVELTIARCGRVLVLAPRLEILGQLVKECVAAGIPVRSVHADHDEGPADAPVVVASIWTLATPRWRNQLPPANLVIIDECHRALAELSYREVLNHYASAKLLGLTATPARSDGRGLGEVFDEIVPTTTTAELTRREFLVPCHVLKPNGDGRGLALPVVESYQEHTPNRLAIVFAASVAHARTLIAEFGAAGIRAGLVTGTTPDAERLATMAAFSSGSIPVLINVACFVEGLDVPACSAAIFARKFGHVGPYLQAIGRTLRPALGKRDSIVLDLLGSSLKHGPPTLDRQYSLDGTGISTPVIKDQIRQCFNCGSVSLAGPPACAYCGTEYPVRPLPALTSDRRGLVALDGTPPPPPAPKREHVVSMTSKRMGICARCGRGIRSGEKIFWATLAKQARHQRCPATAEIGTPA